MASLWRCAIKRSVVMGLILLLGLSVTSCLSDIFNIRPEPVIAIAEGTPYGPAPLTITFDISASSDRDGTIVLFVFDFGDGSEPVQGAYLWQPIEHTYETPGGYLAKLTVTDSRGASASVMLAIGVYEPID